MFKTDFKNLELKLSCLATQIRNLKSKTLFLIQKLMKKNPKQQLISKIYNKVDLKILIQNWCKKNMRELHKQFVNYTDDNIV